MSRAKRPALGRGLSALIPAAEEESAEKAGRPLEVPISQIRQADSQPRTAFREESLQELVDSIRTNGVIQPIIVRQMEAPNDYVIIAGGSETKGRNGCEMLVPRAVERIDGQGSVHLDINSSSIRPNVSDACSSTRSPLLCVE